MAPSLPQILKITTKSCICSENKRFKQSQQIKCGAISWNVVQLLTFYPFVIAYTCVKEKLFREFSFQKWRWNYAHAYIGLLGIYHNFQGPKKMSGQLYYDLLKNLSTFKPKVVLNFWRLVEHFKCQEQKKNAPFCLICHNEFLLESIILSKNYLIFFFYKKREKIPLRFTHWLPKKNLYCSSSSSQRCL